MKYTRIFTLVVSLVFIVDLPALAQDSLTEKEFKQREKRAKERYEGFYKHQKLKVALNQLRENHREEQALVRKRKAEAYEETRLDFVKSRKNVVRVTNNDQHEAELRERKKRHILYRSQYVQRRKSLERLLSRLPRIPEEKDVGLD